MNNDQVRQRGRIRFLEDLEELVRQRMATKPPDSYVASLVSAGDKRLAQKLGEEAVELALAAAAGDRAEQLEEAADLLFHLLVLLNAKGIRLEQVVALLEQRHAARQ
jgi:phosphoribosyl-ATP pyrophosphohydrolase/phosphoribosyl-AMP cyclohydrolase